MTLNEQRALLATCLVTFGFAGFVTRDLAPIGLFLVTVAIGEIWALRLTIKSWRSRRRLRRLERLERDLYALGL